MCEVCGSALPPRRPGPGRPAVYCGAACKNAAAAWVTFAARLDALPPSAAAWVSARVGDLMAERNALRAQASRKGR